MMRKRVLLVSCIFIITTGIIFPVKSQYYKFHQYGIGEGICHNFVYGVTQDKNGFIWALTGYGICRFDGFSFRSNFNDSLPESSALSCFKDKDGNLWFGYSDGSIVFYNGQVFRWLKPSEEQSGSINDLISDQDGNIIAACQGSGLIIIDKNFQKTFVKAPFQGKLIYSLAFLTPKEILVGTDNGVSVFSYGESSFIKEIRQVDGLPFSKVSKILYSNDRMGYWVCTEDAGFYLISPKGEKQILVENFGSLLNLEADNITSVMEDFNSNLWISTFSKGLYKVVLGENKKIADVINYTSKNGLGSDDIKSTFQDHEGNIWVGTFNGNGLAALMGESFIAFDYSSHLKGKNITSVCYNDDGFWVGGENGIIKVTRGTTSEIKFFGIQDGFPLDMATSLYVDSLGNLLIGTDKNGVYQIKKGNSRVTSFFRGENSIANSVNHINGYGRNIYISTKNGIYQYDLKTNNIIHHSTNGGERLPHNFIKQVYVAPDGGAWVATQSSMLFALNRETRYFIKGGQGTELEFNSITRDQGGNFWTGTNGSGVFIFTADTLINFSTRNGLKSDYCYAVLSDLNSNIWVGHRLGLSRISGKQPYQIKVYGSEYITGDINYNAMSMNTQGDIIFGTTDGVIIHESTKGAKTIVPPMVNITSVVINDKIYSDFSKKIVLGYGNYRMTVEFIGLSYNNPEQVLYKFKLDGYDTEWTETKERQARYPRLNDGNYTFRLMARNGDGVWTETDVAFELKIRKPFWKTWWFIAFAFVALVTSVYLIIKIRERKQKEFQEHLEKLLDERTKEVREQKEEIELKNRDITDSINYAQRIQASILPSLRKLQHYFTGSFVYYQPRDIVSGDFYWFDVIPNTNKFILVCADSTGHGVPGAFMSLIGTTLLKDIFNRPDVQKPSDILRHLDNELKSTLNQSVDGERPNDGMDIIVCEIDTQTFKANFASAMRPFIVYQNGEQLYFKGSRSSIGGQIKEEKYFEDVELQLTKGDLIYMFSDGYPDQFGGPLGKKFKMVRLRNLLKDIYQKPMEEQYNYVKSNFELWKGNLEQVDDVIFMGIKI
jgi:ligand-binding sensor domain-containing protein/serine phosphatase RsbU (regulator of sigma subunit)